MTCVRMKIHNQTDACFKICSRGLVPSTSVLQFDSISLIDALHEAAFRGLYSYGESRYCGSIVGFVCYAFIMRKIMR